MTVLFDSDEIRQLCEEQASDAGEPACQFIGTALPLDGLAYADPETRDEYVAQLYLWGVFDQLPDGSYDCTEAQLKQAYAMAAVQSSCGIVTRRVWRGAGVDAPQIYDFYAEPNRIGSAITYEDKFAAENGAWSSGIPWTEGTPWPALGDAFVIGCTSCGGDWSRNSFNGEHEANVVGLGDEGIVYTLDGGQPGVALRTRQVLEVWTGEDDEGRRTGELWCGAVERDGSCATDSSGRPLTGRRFVGISRAADLPLRGTAPACGSLRSRFLPRGVVGDVLGGVLVVGGVVLTGAAVVAGVREIRRRRKRAA